MRLSFNDWEGDYIGDYMEEHRKTWNSNRKSLNEIRKKRTEKICQGKLKDDENRVEAKENSFFTYVVTQYHENKENKIKSEVFIHFKMIYDSIWQHKEIEKTNPKKLKIFFKYKKTDYEKIRTLIEEEYPKLKDYINDFALIVLFAKNECFSEKEIADEMQQAFTEEQRTDIRNFYYGISKEKIDIEEIAIYYNRNKKSGKKKSLKFDAPIFIKMMLYEFAKQYFVWIEKFPEDIWEYLVRECFVETRGRPSDKMLGAIVHIFLNFLEDEQILKEKTLIDKYCLLGQLMEIAGSKKIFKENIEGYNDEKHYYYTIYSNYWNPADSKSNHH